MSSIPLTGSGQKMPLTGFGLWKVDKDKCADVVYAALKAGYRLLDGAADYGNEKQAGEGLARAIKDGIVTREEVFITSKLWNTNHNPEVVEKITRYQLDLWGIEYFDLFLIHFPISLKYVDPSVRFPPEWFYAADGKVELEPHSLQSTWEALEGVHSLGLAKNIGVSNYNGGLLIDLFRYAKVKPAVLQIEHHPYLVQQGLLDLAKELGIAITTYSSFGPQSWVELGMSKDTPRLFDHDVVKTIADKHGRDPAQVLLRWSTQRGYAVIPKSNNPERVASNIKCEDFDLTEDEIKAISGLDRGLRFNNPGEIDIRLSIFA